MVELLAFERKGEEKMIYVFFIIGLILIVKGGDWFVDGASWIAEATGIPKFIIGATIVSLATTLPEIIVSTIAAVEGHQILVSGIANALALSQGKVSMAIGNGIGSVICNTAFIMALSLIFMPICVDRKDFAPKGLLLLLAVVALFFLSLSGSFSMVGGAILLVIFVAFMAENIHSAKKHPTEDNSETEKPGKKDYIHNIILIILGAVCIVLGSNLLVNYGTEIARSLGVSEAIIAVTMVAIGTSLPELVTAITSIVKKQASMSVGNVVGANLIDVTLILAICSFVYRGNLPVSATNIYLDFPVTILVSAIAIIPTIISGKFRRWQGFLLIALYIAYFVIVIAGLPWYLSLFGVAA